jgi:hypothetical protein
VADEHAGRKARCPNCKTVYVVPGQPSRSSRADTEWLMRTQEGDVYGPVPKRELDQWMAEGRVSESAMLQVTGDTTWMPAAHVYPTLAGAGPTVTPFSDAQSTRGSHQRNASTPVGQSADRRRRFRAPHRGGLVLACGILGLLCCQLFAPFAWAAGQADLRAMDRGIMDPEGRSLTQVGMILGIVGTIMLGLFVLFQLAAFA